jgi:hypothetical protein
MSRCDIWVIVAIWIAVVFATGALADAHGVSDDEAEVGACSRALCAWS